MNFALPDIKHSANISLLVFVSGLSAAFAQENSYKTQVAAALSDQPVMFRENKGQFGNTILYTACSYGTGANVSFLQNGLSFALPREIKEAPSGSASLSVQDEKKEEDER